MKLTISITREISIEEISSILVTAFEGGINYWCSRVTCSKEFDGRMSDAFEDDPANRLVLAIYEEDDPVELTLENMLEGITKYIEEGRLGYEEELSCVDAEGADIIVQYAVFKELIFG